MKYRNDTIYQIFIRNYSKEGTIAKVIEDLPRLKDLGITIIYLLPFHPIGEKNRKGGVGSPYAIKDYYAVDPNLGTLDDMKKLIELTHQMGMKIICDIVFNHSAPDNWYVNEHPEFYYRKDGKFGNRIGDWSDIIDFDFTNLALQDELLNVMQYWVDCGFDGFRCDVAPIIPMGFWQKARERFNVLFLSESIEQGFILYLRKNGFLAQSDAEMYQCFDILYDYDVYPHLRDYLQYGHGLEKYIAGLNAQQYSFPVDYVKMHFLENHDVERIASYTSSPHLLDNLTALSFFLPGCAFLYAGQEYKAVHKPNLFEKDPIDKTLTDQKFYNFIKQLIQIKKIPELSSTPIVDITLLCQVVEVSYPNLVGYFNLSDSPKLIKLAPGRYRNILDGEIVENDCEISAPLILEKV